MLSCCERSPACFRESSYLFTEAFIGSTGQKGFSELLLCHFLLRFSRFWLLFTRIPWYTVSLPTRTNCSCVLSRFFWLDHNVHERVAKVRILLGIYKLVAEHHAVVLCRRKLDEFMMLLKYRIHLHVALFALVVVISRLVRRICELEKPEPVGLPGTVFDEHQYAYAVKGPFSGSALRPEGLYHAHREQSLPVSLTS